MEMPLPDMSKSENSIVKKHDKLLKKYQEAKTQLQGIQLGSLYGEMAMFYQAHEFIDAAKAGYQNAIEASPYDYRWHYLLAFVESSLGNFAEAIKLYEAVLDINANYLVAQVRWAELEFETGNFEKSKQLFKSVLEKAPDYSKAIVGLGTISLQNGNSEQAIEYYKKALALQPRANQVHYLLSQSYSGIGDKINADNHLKSSGQRPVIMYDRVLQDMRLHSVSAVYYSQASINAFMNQDYALAEELIKHSITLDPQNINPKFTLMNVLLVTNRTDKAVKLALDLAVVHPKDDRVAYSLGLIYEIKGNDEKAIEWYEKTLKINNNHKTAQLVLANAFMRLKQYNNALIALRKSQKLDTENPYSIYAEAAVLSHLKVCDKAVPKFLEALKKLSNENLVYLTAFVKTVAVCQVKDQQIRRDALNAARNMYLYAPSIRVVQALAMIEAEFGNKQDAIDYQVQAIFQGLSGNMSQLEIKLLQADLELYKKGNKAKTAIKSGDIDINPLRASSIN